MHAQYICKHRGEVCREDRESRNGYRAVTLWFTGLSGSGKSTIAHAVEKRLFDLGAHVYTFDGDNVRHGLCSDLTFSKEDRVENIRRISEMTKLFMDAGTICLAAFITPRRSVQEQLRANHAEGEFFLVHVARGLPGRGLRGARRQGLLQARAGRKDQELHRHHGAI